MGFHDNQGLLLSRYVRFVPGQRILSSSRWPVKFPGTFPCGERERERGHCTSLQTLARKPIMLFTPRMMRVPLNSWFTTLATLIYRLCARKSVSFSNPRVIIRAIPRVANYPGSRKIEVFSNSPFFFPGKLAVTRHFEHSSAHSLSPSFPLNEEEI